MSASEQQQPPQQQPQHGASAAAYSIAVARRFSRYAERMFAANPALEAVVQANASTALSRDWISARLARLGAPAPADGALADEATLFRALRQLRAEVFCLAMARDLAGLADVAEVTGAMTDLAEIAVTRALATLDASLTRLYGAPLAESDGAPLTLGVVGMGKLGGRELNVSSDIDLIFVYEEDGQTAGGERAAISNQEYFSRLGRRLIAALDERTADGYVFRVDMRLRPNGDSGPLVCSLGMLEEYFYTQGREWERYAWIKGRLVSDIEAPAGQRLLLQLDALVRPFVYRRYLDFGVIAAIRSLHVQIGQAALRRATMRPEIADDIKRGRGGIREIEFSAQVFQLIRGGQDAGLRVRPTLAVLEHAVRGGLIAADAAARLTEAYLFLRRLEHRLQYADDAQTHAMPVDAAMRERLAGAMGVADGAALYAELARHRENVEREFDSLFAPQTEPGSSADQAPASLSDDATGSVSDNLSDDGSANPSSSWSDGTPAAAAATLWSDALDDPDADAWLAKRLAEAGFTEAEPARERLLAMRRSARYAELSEASRLRLDALMARALVATARRMPAAARAATLLRFIDLIETISRRSAYLSLLTEFPVALERVLNILGNSRWAAGYLNRHPQLLDELLDGQALSAPFDWPAFKATLRARLAAADNVEQQMDLLRHAHQAEVFGILLHDLAGNITIERVSDALSALADAVLEVTLEAVWRTLPQARQLTPHFAVIAYGKLGGKELGYASDLDLIFLYDDQDSGALDTPELYARFARRLITWLTTPTGAGLLFDVDLRLRPNGASGLLVTALDSFRHYQMRDGADANTAWVWEHQALTRARFCAGDAAIGAAFETIRAQVLAMPRTAAPLAHEIISMRARVSEGHPNRTPLFDLKHDRGGMVDIEFIVQYLVLLHASRHPQLLGNIGNIALLQVLANLGIVTSAAAAAVANAYRDYRAMQHRLRLDGMPIARAEPTLVSAQRHAVQALWQQVFGAFDAAEQAAGADA